MLVRMAPLVNRLACLARYGPVLAKRSSAIELETSDHIRALWNARRQTVTVDDTNNNPGERATVSGW